VGATILTLANRAALWAQDAKDGGGDPWALLSGLFPFILIFVVFYFLLIRPQRREQLRRQAMLAEVKKNDRVITSSGIYGVVTNVHREADEVTIKVDETSNTKLRMTLSSVARVLGDEPPEQTSKP
jgi:preprotein translocase subunit YajC